MAEVQYRTIPIDRILKHPDNPNKLTPEARERIKSSIEDRHLYPTIVVRSLEESIERREDHAKGLFETLDGHQRLDILTEIGITEVRVEVWPGVTDKVARLYILNLNDGGEDDAAKRQDLLLKVQREMEADCATMAKMVRESAVELQNLSELASKPTSSPSEPRAAGGSDVATFQLFVMPEHQEIIAAAIEKAREVGIGVPDPSGLAVEGAALAGICKSFLEQ